MLRLLFSGLFLASLGSAAHAAVVSVDVPLCSLERTVPLTAAGDGLSSGTQICTLSVPMFDASQGTLNSVNIVTTVGGVHAVTATSTAATAQTINVAASASTGLSSNDPALSGPFNQTLGSISGTGRGMTIAAGGGSSLVAEMRLFNQAHTTAFTGAYAQGFVGTGDVDLQFSTVANIRFLDETGTTIAPLPSLSLIDAISEIGGTLRITYDFTAAVPPTGVAAPGSLGLLLLGLGLVAARRRKAAE